MTEMDPSLYARGSANKENIHSSHGDFSDLDLIEFLASLHPSAPPDDTGDMSAPDTWGFF